MWCEVEHKVRKFLWVRLFSNMLPSVLATFKTKSSLKVYWQISLLIVTCIWKRVDSCTHHRAGAVGEFPYPHVPWILVWLEGNALICRLTNLPSCFPAQPLPDLPPQHQRADYTPLVAQEHLSLWDSLSFTDKVNQQPAKNKTGSAAQTNCHRVVESWNIENV